MKALNLFIVELDKLINDTIKTESGLEFFIDTRFEMGEFNNRINEGKIVSPPIKWDTGAKEGDTLYFHHHVVIQGGQKLFGNDYTDKNYICMYDHDNIMANQAIAYKSQDDGEINVVGGWIIMEPYYDERVPLSDIIEDVHLEDQKLEKGRLAFESEGSKELEVKVGDILGFRGSPYKFKIDGKDYIRMSKDFIDYVQEEVHDA